MPTHTGKIYGTQPILTYCAGFLFSHDRKLVALIRKVKPAWQVGKLNAIGGKVEEGEASIEAMNREFREEAGMDVTDWRCFLSLDFTGGFVHFFETTGDLSKVRDMTSEQIIIVPTLRLHEHRVIPNLHWIIPMALDPEIKFANVRIYNP